MPLTELWLSAVARKQPPGPNGYASPTSRSAPLAFAVKMQVYSTSSAPKKRSTSPRACSASAVDAAEVGLTECGLPKTARRNRLRCSSTCEAAYRLPPA
ncbi:MAG: hypothetical protein R2736_20610 [Solirubrobacterales bacterium]